MEDIFFVFTVRYGDHWPWCSGAQLPSLKLAHGRRKNRRNISAEIYNAVKMSLFPFPPQGDGRGTALQQPGCQADCGLGVGGWQTWVRNPLPVDSR